MKTLTKEEAIIAMVKNGEQVTSDEFDKPDEWYVFYNPQDSPFQLNKDNNIYTFFNWDIKTWRLRRYVPKDKELVFCWDKECKAHMSIRYYDAKNSCTFCSSGERNGYPYNYYAAYTGELPPNMCKPEELED